MDSRLVQRQAIEARQEQRLATLLQQAAVLEMPEDELARLVRDVEQSPLFQRLYRQERVVGYQRFPRTDISRRVFEAGDSPRPDVASPGGFDAETLLAHQGEVAATVKKLGMDEFKRYFLFAESAVAPEEIAAACRLTLEEVRRVNQFIDEFAIASEFYHPSAIADRTVRYSRVAAIERGPDGFVLAYYSPAHARGRFAINYERVEQLQQEGAFDAAETRELRALLRKLEMINTRRDTLNRVLQMVTEKQAMYLDSGDPRTLLPFTQRESARRTGLAASSISRVIAGRSVDTPWGEKPLKDFFPRPRRFRKELIARVLAAETRPLPDEAVRARLRERFGVAISRRAVASLRQELKIPNSRKRGRLKVRGG